MLHRHRQQLERAGVTKLYVAHDLRHAVASVLLVRGTPPPEVAAILGHAGPHVTAAVCAHLVPRAGRTALEDAEAYCEQLEREAGRDEETAIRTASSAVAPPRRLS